MINKVTLPKTKMMAFEIQNADGNVCRVDSYNHVEIGQTKKNNNFLKLHGVKDTICLGRLTQTGGIF